VTSILELSMDHLDVSDMKSATLSEPHGMEIDAVSSNFFILLACAEGFRATWSGCEPSQLYFNVKFYDVENGISRSECTQDRSRTLLWTANNEVECHCMNEMDINEEHECVERVEACPEGQVRSSKGECVDHCHSNVDQCVQCDIDEGYFSDSYACNECAIGFYPSEDLAKCQAIQTPVERCDPFDENTIIHIDPFHKNKCIADTCSHPDLMGVKPTSSQFVDFMSLSGKSFQFSVDMIEQYQICACREHDAYWNDDLQRCIVDGRQSDFCDQKCIKHGYPAEGANTDRQCYCFECEEGYALLNDFTYTKCISVDEDKREPDDYNKWRFVEQEHTGILIAGKLDV
jgi:hypothetical protein